MHCSQHESCIYTRGLGTPTASQHNIFDALLKTQDDGSLTSKHPSFSPLISSSLKLLRIYVKMVKNFGMGKCHGEEKDRLFFSISVAENMLQLHHIIKFLSIQFKKSQLQSRVKAGKLIYISR